MPNIQFLESQVFTRIGPAASHLMDCERQHLDFKVSWHPDRVEISPDYASSPAKKLQNWENFLNFVNAKLKYKNIHNLSPDQYRPLKKVMNYCYRKFQKLQKQYPNHSKLKEIKFKTYVAKLGGGIHPSSFENSQFLTFVEANKLFHAFCEMQKKIEGGAFPHDPTLTVIDRLGGKEEIRWSMLKETHNKVEQRRVFHSPSGKIAFETENNYRLTHKYTLTDEGIHHYDYYNGEKLLPQMHRPPGESKFPYQLDICNVMMDQGGSWQGMHSWIVLRDKKGNVISAGGWGPADALNCFDVTSPLGKKEGRVGSPDMYPLFPKDKLDYFKVIAEITEEHHQKFCELILEARKAPHKSFSILGDNCLTWISDKIEKATGFKIRKEIALERQLFTKFPKIIQKTYYSIKKYTYDRLPKFMQGIIDFGTFPLRYLYSVAVGLFFKLFALLNHKGLEGSDITFKKILTMNCTVDHPEVMRKHLKQVAPNGILDLSKQVTNS